MTALPFTLEETDPLVEMVLVDLRKTIIPPKEGKPFQLMGRYLSGRQVMSEPFRVLREAREVAEEIAEELEMQVRRAKTVGHGRSWFRKRTRGE